MESNLISNKKCSIVAKKANIYGLSSKMNILIMIIFPCSKVSRTKTSKTSKSKLWLKASYRSFETMIIHFSIYIHYLNNLSKNCYIWKISKNQFEYLNFLFCIFFKFSVESVVDGSDLEYRKWITSYEIITTSFHKPFGGNYSKFVANSIQELWS